MKPIVSVMFCSTEQFGVRVAIYNSFGKDLESPESEEEDVPVIQIFDGGECYHYIISVNPPGNLDLA